MRPFRIKLALAAICLIFGTTFLTIKLGVSAGAPPFLFAGSRFALAGLVLGIFLLASGKATLRGLAALAPRAACLSLLYISFNFGATFWAEQYIDSAAAAQIDAVCPIAAALLSALFLKKKLKPPHFIGIAAGFAGVWLIVRGSALGGPASGSSAPAGMKLIASLVMLVAAVGFAGSQVLYRRLFGEGDDPFAVNSLNMLFGGIGLLILSALFERRAFPIDPAALLPLAYLIVFGSLLGHSLNLWLVKRAGPLYASSWSYVSPAIATLAGALFSGERIFPLSLAGMAATLAGVALITRAEKQPGN